MKHNFLKSVLCIALTACMLLPLVSCASGGQTQATTQSPSIDRPQDTTWTADEAAMRKAEGLAPSHELMIGAWVTPRPHYTATQEEADAQYALMKEAGINMAYSFGDTGDRAHLDRILNAAYKNGVSIIIDLSPTVFESNISANLETVLFTKDYPAVIGYHMQDEPNATTFEVLGLEYDAIREIVGDDKIILCNLYPNYAKPAQIGISAADGLTAYQNYLDKCMRLTHSDILSFDYYPYKLNSTRTPGFLENLSDVALCGKKYQAPTWGFIQSAKWEGMRLPHEGELRLNSHLCLAFGLDSFSCFVYAQPAPDGTDKNYFGPIDYEGNKTEVYPLIQQNNLALAGMQGRYLEYELEGICVSNLKNTYVTRIPEALTLEKVGSLSKTDSSQNVLISYFKNEAGEDAYYLVNMDYNKSNTVTLHLDQVSDYTLWGADGIEQMGGQKTISFDLLPGEGKFLEMKTFTEN